MPVKVDTAPPVLVGVPAATTISCNATNPGAQGVTATDDCTTPQTVTFSAAAFVPDASCPNEGSITNTWTATDECGKTTTDTQVITFSDTDPPVLIGIPADITISCDASNPGAQGVTATDNCTMPQAVTFTQDIFVPDTACPNGTIVTNSWTAVDGCGNTTTQTQEVSIIDNKTPSIQGCPSDLVLVCGEADILTTINAYINSSITSIESMSTGSCGTSTTTSNFVGMPPGPVCDLADGGLEVIFTFSDVCGNAATCSSNIIIQDAIPPTITCPTPDPLLLECGAFTEADVNASLDLATATDQCDGALVVANDYLVGSLDDP